MNRISLALAVSLATISLAQGQTYKDTNGTIVQGVVPLSCPVGGGTCTGPSGGGGGGAVTATDGALATIGTTTDTSSANTLIGLMKSLIATASGAITAGTNVIGKVGIDQTTPGTSNLVSQYSASGDACNSSTAHLQQAFAITSATQTSLVAAVAAQKIYICSIIAITGIADNVNFYDVASAGACSSASTDAVIGANSNTATNGLNLAANGGITFGNGAGTVAFTPTANATLCVVTSSSGPFSGTIIYVQK